MNREKKENVLLALVIIEFIIGTIFMVIYLKLEQESGFKSVFFILCFFMYFTAAIIIIVNELGTKVSKIVKKVSEFVFSITIGIVLRVFDSFFNMASGSRSMEIENITGYEDSVSSVRVRKKRKKANYKRYKLMDNREKVRFLYYKKVTKAVRKGYFFKESDTAFEVKDKLIERKYISEEEKDLGEIYSLSRYDSKSEITDEMVEALK